MTTGKPFEYIMSTEMAKGILKDRQGDDKRVPNQKFLCDYVNRECGLMGVCVKVIVK
nr:MAG TPA: hypothetical protein [Caudoviricetes sp.]